MQLNGGWIFSKLDLLEVYLQIPVYEKCAEILRINMHKGLYKFLRLPYGIKVAPVIFQQVMDTMLIGLDFAIAYLDDILIKNKTWEEHARHVKEVFIKNKSLDLSWVLKNVNFFKPKIKYLGQIIDEKRRRPDPSWANAIKNMPAPTNVSSL